MPINRLLKGKMVEPGEIEILNRALDQALGALLVDRNDPITDIVARTIIQIGATGVRDSAGIAASAIRQLNSACGRWI
jgi:hypothetical protein